MSYPRCAGSNQPALRTAGRRGQCPECGGVLAMKKDGVMWEHKDFRRGDKEAMNNQEHADAIAAIAAEHAAALIEVFGDRAGLFALGPESLDGEHAGIVVVCNEPEGCAKLVELIEQYQATQKLESVTGAIHTRAKGATH